MRASSASRTASARTTSGSSPSRTSTTPPTSSGSTRTSNPQGTEPVRQNDPRAARRLVLRRRPRRYRRGGGAPPPPPPPPAPPPRPPRRPEVLADVGPFSGLFRLGSYRDPVLVASTDSVGTKVKLAVLLERYEGLGHDLVNHCVNDALTAGAEPLFFLDYIGGSGVTDEAKLALVGGVAAACREAGCALLGGETADMPGPHARRGLGPPRSPVAV